MDQDELIRKIKKAKLAKPEAHISQTAMACIDLTSLTGNETDDDIKALCNKSKAGPVGGVCVYPKHIRMVADYLRSHDIAIATVINFPFGEKTNDGDIATPENTYESCRQAIANGADEIDIVIDYKNFTEENARELLRACRKACDEGKAKMKVILEVENGNLFKELPSRTQLAIIEGADMIKTSTGKYPDAMSTHEKMECVLIMIDEIKKSHRNVGLKISGGVNADNYAPYLALVQSEMGTDFIKPSTFRFGASGLYDDLKPSTKPRPNKSALAY